MTNEITVSVRVDYGARWTVLSRWRTGPVNLLKAFELYYTLPYKEARAYGYDRIVTINGKEFDTWDKRPLTVSEARKSLVKYPFKPHLPYRLF